MIGFYIQPSGTTVDSPLFHFNVNDKGDLILEYDDKGDHPIFTVNEDNDLICSYMTKRPPDFYIDEEGCLWCQEKEKAFIDIDGNLTKALKKDYFSEMFFIDENGDLIYQWKENKEPWNLIIKDNCLYQIID